MATLNVSDEQKTVVLKAVEVVSEALGSKQSQADIVAMGAKELIRLYGKKD